MRKLRDRDASKSTPDDPDPAVGSQQVLYASLYGGRF